MIPTTIKNFEMEDYYQNNFNEYHQQTFNIDPSSFLFPLEKRLSPGVAVMDVGCGSGRDLLWFKERGYSVVGFEKSDGLAALARKNAGCEIIEGDFETYDFSSLSVDAILLVGTLVHVPHEKLAGILALIIQSLRTDGYVLMTLKEGTGIKELPDGRLFYLWDHSSLMDLFAGYRGRS